MSIPINPNQSPCSMMCHRHWKEAGWSALRGTPGLFISAGISRKNLGFPNSEHFGATGWTRTLGSGSLILHSDSLGILHFLLGLTFHTVCLHVFTSFLLRTINYSLYHVNGKRYLTQRSHSLNLLPNQYTPLRLHQIGIKIRVHGLLLSVWTVAYPWVTW